MSKLKLSDGVCCLSLESACSTTVQLLLTVRFLPDGNSVMEGMITICTLPTVLTKFIHSILKIGSNVIIKKNQHQNNAQNNYYNTQLSDIHLAQYIMTCKEIYYVQDTWNNEMWTFLSSNFHFMISYGWIMKCLQYKTATSSTYTIVYPISTLKKWVINIFMAYINVPTSGK
jgi:hypothetical protein